MDNKWKRALLQGVRPYISHHGDTPSPSQYMLLL